jgi:hypothetical protein
MLSTPQIPSSFKLNILRLVPIEEVNEQCCQLIKATNPTVNSKNSGI